MATDVTSVTELELFHRFVSERLANGGRQPSVEQCLAEFREYQRDVNRLREEIGPALESSLRGESRPFDVEGIKRRGRERLRERGISD